MAHKTLRSKPEDIVTQIAARRLLDESKANENFSTVEDALVFTDVQEFVQGVNTDFGDKVRQEFDSKHSTEPPLSTMINAYVYDAMEDQTYSDSASAPSAIPEEEPPPPRYDAPILTEQHVVKKGLASTLALLKEKAQLDDAQNTRWSGRANDMKDRFDKAHVLDAHAVNDETVDGYKFGFKLDKFDEFGRKLTPKEAFRELCHRFHGIEPGKMKREKRLRQFQEEQARLKAKSSMDVKVKDVQREQATPYVVLSGSVSAGQTKRANPLATLKKE